MVKATHCKTNTSTCAEKWGAVSWNLCQVWVSKALDKEACRGSAGGLQSTSTPIELSLIDIGYSPLVHNVEHFVIQPRLTLCLLCSAKEFVVSIRHLPLVDGDECSVCCYGCCSVACRRCCCSVVCCRCFGGFGLDLFVVGGCCPVRSCCLGGGSCVFLESGSSAPSLSIISRISFSAGDAIRNWFFRALDRCCSVRSLPPQSLRVGVAPLGSELLRLFKTDHFRTDAHKSMKTMLFVLHPNTVDEDAVCFLCVGRLFFWVRRETLLLHRNQTLCQPSGCPGLGFWFVQGFSFYFRIVGVLGSSRFSSFF